MIAARRNSLPTREELQERTAALTAHLAPSARRGTPGEVFANEAQLARPGSARRDRILDGADMEIFEQALARIEEGEKEQLTALQMANEVSVRLGLEGVAPMTRLVDEAAAVLGLQLSGTMISRLKICYEHATGAVQPDRKAAIATSTAESADAEAEKGPSLGERLLAKGLVSGCSVGS